MVPRLDTQASKIWFLNNEHPSRGSQCLELVKVLMCYQLMTLRRYYDIAQVLGQSRNGAAEDRASADNIIKVDIERIFSIL